jgi:hypothetical protein
MILTSALECQVPCDDNDDEVVDINEVAYPKRHSHYYAQEFVPIA